jgi:hypothetical protein
MNRIKKAVVAILLAVPLVGLAAPGTASAAPGWVYWATYPDAVSCILTGNTLAYPGSPIYAAYYCEEEVNGSFVKYELFLYKRF